MMSEPQDRRVRYVCEGCGGWRETDHTLLTWSLMQGYTSDSKEGQKVSEAKKSEGPFMVKHIEQCMAPIMPVYPEDPEWDQVDPDKKEP